MLKVGKEKAQWVIPVVLRKNLDRDLAELPEVGALDEMRSKQDDLS